MNRDFMPERDALLHQRVFRILLETIARPGTVRQIPEDAFSKPYGDLWGCILILRGLLDHEVTFSVVSAAGYDGYLAANISLLTGARIRPLEQADFVLIRGGDSRGAVRRAKRGTIEYPELGATLVYQVREILEEGDGPCAKPMGEPDEVAWDDFLRVTLRGPGVKGEKCLTVRGWPEEEVQALSEARRGFPLGVDVVLCDVAGKVACIPRSVSLLLEVPSRGLR